jgi:guanosine-3',5'-bis(diphosphate) 3'-pyrophosphohydrolase
MKNTSLIDKALVFATEKHKNHTRADKAKSPYIVHPIAVRHILSEVGGVEDVEVLAAALLHDTLEDTPTTREELIENFGQRVCSMVEEVSDDKTLPKQTRKDIQIEHAPQLSEGAVLIKLGDKISNVTDIAHTPPTNWNRSRCLEYLDWAEEVILNCRKVNTALENHFATVITKGRKIISK